MLQLLLSVDIKTAPIEQCSLVIVSFNSPCSKTLDSMDRKVHIVKKEDIVLYFAFLLNFALEIDIFGNYFYNTECTCIGIKFQYERNFEELKPVFI